jgi:hypothetical protein
MTKLIVAYHYIANAPKNYEHRSKNASRDVAGREVEWGML